MAAFYRTETFNKEHIHFGGVIYLSDFNTEYREKDNIRGSSIAARIESDFRWEKRLLKRLGYEIKTMEG